MPRPYRLMLALFAALGALAALDAALAALGVTPFLTGLRWLRVHAVTLGLVTEAAFGLLPAMAARRAGRPRPPDDHGRWLLLHAGLVALLVGIPLVRPPMIAVGGLLVLAAALWLALDVARLGRPAAADAAHRWRADGQPYALTALAFLAVGALVGTGLWIGWGPWLGIAVPKETHVHAVVWGFASLFVAGLAVDLAAQAAPAGGGRRAAGPWALIAAGAAALLAAPWLGDANGLMVGGIVVYAVGTLWLAAAVLRPLARPFGPGAAHLLTGYLWILVPAGALPFVVLGSGGLPVARVESVGPSILAYGWLLQVVIALLPPAADRADGGSGAPGATGDVAALGGTWPSWVAVNGCAAALVASIALPAHEAQLGALAFALLAAVLAGLAVRLARRMG